MQAAFSTVFSDKPGSCSTINLTRWSKIHRQSFGRKDLLLTLCAVPTTRSCLFDSRSMKVVCSTFPVEKAYSQPDRKGLVIIFAVSKFHKMLFGRISTLPIDRAPPLRNFGSENVIPLYTTNRMQRWAVQFLIYDLNIAYVNTSKFGNAYSLFRLFDQHVKPEEDIVVSASSRRPNKIDFIRCS